MLADTTSSTAPIPDTTRTTTTTVPVATVTTTASVSVMDAPALPDEALFLRSYSLGQRVSEVVALQSVLGLTADGWYWTQTRQAHLARLVLLQLSTSGVPQEVAATSNPVSDVASTTPSAQETCKTQAYSFVDDILSTWGIPSPQIVFDETIRCEYYKAGWGVVVAKTAATRRQQHTNLATMLLTWQTATTGRHTPVRPRATSPEADGSKEPSLHLVSSTLRIASAGFYTAREPTHVAPTTT